MSDVNGVGLPDIPSFLKRNSLNQSEVTMSKLPEKALSPETEAAPAPKPAKTPKVKAVKAKTNGKAKAAPTKKAAVKTAPIKRDEFGFKKDSLKSRAAAMYAAKRGATLIEVKDKLNSVQFNLLTELATKGFKVRKEIEKGADNRKVSRYFIQAK